MGSAENLHVVERFTRVAADMLDYEMTLDDPTTWTRPWTVLIHLKQSRRTSSTSTPVTKGTTCTMEGILGAARADENGCGEDGADQIRNKS